MQNEIITIDHRLLYHMSFQKDEFKLIFAMLAVYQFDNPNYQTLRLEDDNNLFTFSAHNKRYLNVLMKTIGAWDFNGQQILDVRFSADNNIEFKIKQTDLFTNKSKNAVHVPLSAIKNLSSGAAISLYLLLKEYEIIGKRVLDIEHLKAIIGFNGQYHRPEYHEMLKVVHEDIEKHSDIDFNHFFDPVDSPQYVFFDIISKSVLDQVFDGINDPFQTECIAGCPEYAECPHNKEIVCPPKVTKFLSALYNQSDCLDQFMESFIKYANAHTDPNAFYRTFAMFHLNEKYSFYSFQKAIKQIASQVFDNVKPDTFETGTTTEQIINGNKKKITWQ